ncbi:glycosyltransferase family 2 protein [Actinomadura rupiterrae]|uniref:glycosyltransferase family 2 protein n=1 Tax=Actinomadura rupiterrae TaxID=559627 RepID=UPI0020A39051|nr:glycosyltransferase family 2 protein [Actinomadura rupiterrae]MCP2335320.1 GT2 family glycosyltransferase [Actinomadura rupiterrae]
MPSPLDRHAVTAVLVTHDGVRWLPEALKALLTQSRPVRRLVVADTGSRDRGPDVAAEVVGSDAVVRLSRTTGFGEAVAAALRHPGATLPNASAGPDRSPDGASGAEVEWIWLLHDDSAPAPDALARLLKVADADPRIGVLGPKLRGWNDRRVLLAAGETMDGAGRRDLGFDPGDFDQGQHDGDRDVLVVSTAGMLVRRDVWDRLGGLDPQFGLFRDDADFCFRVHAAGLRVVVVTDAVVHHAEAARRGIREIGLTDEPLRRLDRRNAMLALLANRPVRALPGTFARIVWSTFLHVAWLLLVKRPDAAKQEFGALMAVLRSPRRLWRARSARAEGRAHAHRYVQRLMAHGLARRRANEALHVWLAERDARRAAEREDAPLEDNGWRAVARRFLARPGVLLVLALTVVTVAAERSLVTTGTRLAGGALAAPTGGASDLWHAYAAAWHPTGLGSDPGTPPWVGVLALVSTLTFGKPWVAVNLLLLGSVPLAGVTALVAARRLIPPRTPYRAALRLWVAGTYALLPAATGAIADGRLGTSMVIVLLPLIALLAYRALTDVVDSRASGRAAWATALFLTVAMAFVPLAWPLVVAAAALVTAPRGLPVDRGARNMLIVAAVPPLLLGPWTLGLLLHPSRFLLEAGVLPTGRAPATAADLLGLAPGGPAVPWAVAGLGLAAFVALLVRERRGLVLTGWGLVGFGLVTAILLSSLTASSGSDRAPYWSGVPLLFAGVGAVMAASVGLRRAVFAVTGQRRLVRAGGALLLGAACTTPVLAACVWIADGASGPLGRFDPDTIPVFLHDSTGPRTVVLRDEPSGRVDYTVLRGAAPGLADTAVPDGSSARNRLDALVSGLAGGTDTDEAPGFGALGVRYVLVRHPGDDPLTPVLDAAPELSRLSRSADFATWEVRAPAGRLTVQDGDGRTVKVLPGGSSAARTDVRIPPGNGPRTLTLAEPDDGGWHATLDGHPLKGRSVNGWSRVYEVPATGGAFALSHGMRMRHIWIAFQGAALLAVLFLALPGARLDEPAPTAAQQARAHGRRAPTTAATALRRATRQFRQKPDEPVGSRHRAASHARLRYFKRPAEAETPHAQESAATSAADAGSATEVASATEEERS